MYDFSELNKMVETGKVKIVKENAGYDMQQALPYEGAKPMYLVEDLDDREKLVRIVLDTCRGLKNKR